MKKFVLKLNVQDESDKRRALKTVSTLSGIDEVSIDMKGKKLTMVGTVDPVSVVSKLRKKNWSADIISVGPAKEPEKKEAPKKEEPKKEEAKKEEPKKEEAKKEEVKKEEAKETKEKKEEPRKEALKIEERRREAIAEPAIGQIAPYNYRPYHPPMNTYYYVHHSIEENPNACAIC